MFGIMARMNYLVLEAQNLVEYPSQSTHMLS
jgi:hypothetical protein